MRREDVDASDAGYMRMALALAARGAGRTWPNPTVGCVIVAGGQVVGRGWTQPGGRPHGETEALRRAGAAARGACVYVSLEPCIHHGGTPPCVDALLAAGIGRAVVALEDPDPRVAGRGIKALRAAGVPVSVGTLADEAGALNQGFILRITRGRPLFTLKLATSLDGRIASASGESRWITGETARAYAHRLRAQHDAVLVGIDTAVADDPDLGCRLPGFEAWSPVRLVADTSARLPPERALVRTARQRPTWLLTASPRSPAAEALRQAGVRVLPVDRGADGHLNPEGMAAALAEQGLTRVLAEGGGRLARSLLAAGLIDRLVWFHAPMIIGGGGLAAVGTSEAAGLAAAFRFVRREIRPVGDDVMEIYQRAG
ncbi:MAG: bifunctional diaminohydroxyphosphoribosylaminopyrimidine deaminase/5-amino-6-(5-phosphoribosylamino)uracil reductase RibD [Rhodospirillales bacterium]